MKTINPKLRRKLYIRDMQYRMSQHFSHEHSHFNQMLTRAFYEIRAQLESLNSLLPQINTLALGSSHIKYAFNPNIYSLSSFNFGSDSQDIFHSSTIYKHFLKKLPNLKTLIIGISVFTPGYDIAKTKRRYISDIFQYLFDYTRQGHQLLFCNFKKFNKLGKQRFPVKHFQGYFKASCKPSKHECIHHRIISQLRENKRKPEQTPILKEFICHAISHNVEPILIICPLTNYAKQILPSYEILFSGIDRLSQKYGIKVIDAYNIDHFTSYDFIDCDHLNEQGAEKFSLFVKERILH